MRNSFGIENQQLACDVSKSALWRFNLTHFTVQYGLYCAVKWLGLPYKMAKIGTQGISR